MVLNKKYFTFCSLLLGICLNLACIPAALAQTIPNTADVSRIKPVTPLVPLNGLPGEQITVPQTIPVTPAPKNADSIHFVLSKLIIEGNHVFSDPAFRPFYEPYVGKNITLADVYKIAPQITQLYREKGYFLSLAYVPEQKITDGIVHIKIIEGYIANVILQGDVFSHDVINDYSERLKAEKPIRLQTLESMLLRLNDLAGYSFDALLSPNQTSSEGAVNLTLTTSPKKGQGMLRFDNFSSRFLGPHEALASYTTSLVPLQQTTVSFLNGAPLKKLHYVSLDHSAVIAPDVTLNVSGSEIKAKPGYSLKPFDLKSNATFLGATLNYQWIRQREENLSISLGLDGRNSNTDALGASLTRDRIRAVRSSLNYDLQDAWNGYTASHITLSQGIKGLGSSKEREPTLSRAEAVPDFTKLELSLSRLQAIDKDWSVLLSASGQVASDPLFSSEEFGYGGQAFGRAFDSSELGGDHGIAGSLELRYSGWTVPDSATFSPYAFYDIGRVWNIDHTQVARETASSVGIGLRGRTDFNLNANLGIAFPLIRNIDTPVYGDSGSAPRLLFELSQEF